MSLNKAMKASHADVLGHEVPKIRRRRGQTPRNWGGQRAMFTQRHGRISYRGTTRHRDTKAMPGHPLAGLWPSGPRSMRRSHRPEVRRWAVKQLRQPRVWVDEMAGVNW